MIHSDIEETQGDQRALQDDIWGDFEGQQE